MNERGQQYVERMASPCRSGLTDISTIVATTGEPLLRSALLELQIISELDKVSWEDSELPNITTSTDWGGPMQLEAREAARHFMSFAFRDARRIHGIALSAFEQAGIPRDFSAVLVRSKRNLLAPARLKDSDKANLLNALEFPSLAKEFGGPKHSGNPLVLTADGDGEAVLDWIPDIKDWLSQRPAAGCPAFRTLIQTPDGRTTPLIYYFWDRLAEAMYPQSPESSSESI